MLALLYAGCAESARIPSRSNMTSRSDSQASTNSDEELKASPRWSSYPDNQRGYWLEGKAAQEVVTLEDVSLELETPPPEIGFVPPWSFGHSLLGTVTNHSREFVAEVELIVTAVAKNGDVTLAEMNTESMEPHLMIAPGQSDDRWVKLTNRFGQEVSPFDDVKKWPPFYLKANVHRVRIIDEAAHLSYLRKIETEAAAYREAHKNDQGPKQDD